jgi:hypothetical protein
MAIPGESMRILDGPVTKDELKSIAGDMFGDIVKGVVDVRLDFLAIDAELHSDLEAMLLENGSQQNDLWGINLYPSLEGDDFLEFDSMINMRPSQGNLSRGVDDEALRDKIAGIVDRWVTG